MSMVTVHGPNTMYTDAPGILKDPSGTATASPNASNGLQFTFQAPNPGARPAADFDWTFTGPGSPAAQADRFNGTVTFTGPGAGTIVLTVAAGAGPPAGGTYTIPVTAVSGMPRSAPPEEEGQQVQVEPLPPEQQPDVEVAYDPGAHTVPDVIQFAEDNPDQVQALLDAELAGRSRSTLVSQLEDLLD